MHVRIGWGREFQIRGARFEKQTEPDVVRGRKGVKQDWFPLVSWECFVRFSFLQMSCGAVPKWHFCTIRASWRAQRCSMLDNRSSTNRGPTAHCQVAPAVQRIAKWTLTYNYGDLNFSGSQQVFANLFSWRKLEHSLIISWKFQDRTSQEIWITATFPAWSRLVSHDVLHHRDFIK